MISAVIEAITESQGKTKGGGTCYVFNSAEWVGQMRSGSPRKTGKLSLIPSMYEPDSEY